MYPILMIAAPWWCLQLLQCIFNSQSEQCSHFTSHYRQRNTIDIIVILSSYAITDCIKMAAERSRHDCNGWQKLKLYCVTREASFYLIFKFSLDWCYSLFIMIKGTLKW
jgi:hypothetical protein